MISGSVTHAAEVLCISQPAVSRLILDLEEALDFSLFERQRGQALQPTEEAEALFAEVDKAFIGLEHLIKTARNIHSSRGHLRVIGPGFLMNSILSDATAQILTEWRGASVTLDTRPHAELISLIAGRQQDIGVAVLPVEEPSVKVIELGAFEAVCAISNKLDLARRPVIEPADLNGQSLIISSHGSQMQSLTDNMLGRHQVQVERRIIVRTQESACSLVAQGIGIAIIASPLPRHIQRYPGVIIRKFEPGMAIQLGIIISSFKAPSRLMARYIDALKRLVHSYEPSP